MQRMLYDFFSLHNKVNQCMYIETTYNKEMRSYFYEVGSCHTRDLCTNLLVKYSFEVSLTRIYPSKFHFYLYF